MSTSRILPIVNLIGCLSISGIIPVQWLIERDKNEQLVSTKSELVATRKQLSDEIKRTLGLEGDVEQLKEFIASLVRTRDETEEAMTKLIAEHAQKAATLQANSSSTVEQVKVWEDAIAARDERIKEMSASLSATRSRLDEAIAKLKEAGAR